MRTRILKLALFVPLVVVAGPGCERAYYRAMEEVGTHKRDLLVDRVEKAKESQEEAVEEFETAMEQFRSVVEFDGGEIEEKYDTLSKALERSEARAQAVRDRIDAVESVSEALFSEWEKELKEYSDHNLATASEQTLRETRKRYGKLIHAMHQAESHIDPVLSPLRDQVLFLKHNLNAKAIASLQEELITVQLNVTELIVEMQAAIAEAEAFIQQMADERPG